MIFLDTLKPISPGESAVLVCESNRLVKLVAIAVPTEDAAETNSNFVIVEVSVGWNGPALQHRLTVRNISSKPLMCRFNGLEAHELKIEQETGNTIGEMQRDGTWSSLTALQCPEEMYRQ